MIMRSRTLRAAIAAVCATVLATGLAGCGGSKKKASAPPPPSSSSVAPTPSPTPTSRAAAAPVDPLTGGRPSSNPVVAVKIDDTANGRPQIGIDQADIVYIEQVEGGVSRLLAVFHTHRPQTVGPVRSVRSNDPEILGAYGPIGFVASGGGGDSLPTLDRSSLKADINDRGGPGFFRDNNRNAPYNLMLALGSLPSSIGGAARTPGWSYSADPAQAKQGPAATDIQAMVGSTPVHFIWDGPHSSYVRLIDGAVQKAADGTVIRPANIIVQYCQGYTNPADVDVAGNPGHFTRTVGTGRVAVFRGGHRIDGTWTRAKAAYGTTLRDGHGAPIRLAPGSTWVVLVTS